VNALKAVQLAESIGTGSAVGTTLLVDRPALSATVDQGHSKTLELRVTNEGAAAQTILPTVSGRPTTLAADTGTVTLSLTTSPAFIDGQGATAHFALHQFTVPAGADYLNGDITWTSTASQPAGVFETLFDPQGRIAGYSQLGTSHSGFGHVEVRRPDAGTWTAVIFTVGTTTGYSGPVQFSFTSQQFQHPGSVTRTSLTLQPGRSGVFHVTVPGGQAGDESFSLHLGTGADGDGSIPIVVRTLVPLNPNGGSFAGTVTGGGRVGSDGGQSLTYQFKLPDKPALNVGIQLADANYDVQGFLVDPNGEPVDVQSTALFDANDNRLGFGNAMQFFRGKSVHGLWTLTLRVAGPVDGTHLSEPFTGTISFAALTISSSGIPSSPGTVLPAGQPRTATLSVTNTGDVRKDYFADARLNGLVLQTLVGSNVSGVQLPLAGPPPTWLVPTGTTSLTVTAQATVPVTMDVSAANGEPDVLGASSGNNSVATLTDPEVAPGMFVAFPAATGPFTSGGVGGGASVNLSAVATTNQFDSTVSASSGDFWARSVNSSAPYTPLSLGPGETGSITLTFTPNAPKGKEVRGFVAVDTLNPDTFSGDALVKIPYAYKVG
jgi:hypothetical protein